MRLPNPPKVTYPPPFGQSPIRQEPGWVGAGPAPIEAFDCPVSGSITFTTPPKGEKVGSVVVPPREKIVPSVCTTKGGTKKSYCPGPNPGPGELRVVHHLVTGVEAG